MGAIIGCAYAQHITSSENNLPRMCELRSPHGLGPRLERLVGADDVILEYFLLITITVETCGVKLVEKVEPHGES